MSDVRCKLCNKIKVMSLIRGTVVRAGVEGIYKDFMIRYNVESPALQGNDRSARLIGT